MIWAGDGHRSPFDADWLAEHAYDDGPRRAADGPDAVVRRDRAAPPEVAYDAVMVTTPASWSGCTRSGASA